MPNDSNGIYKYTETDTASTASTLLNRLANSVSTKVASIVADVLLAPIMQLDGYKNATAPAAGTRLRVKVGRRAYTSVAGGTYRITYGAAFPTGIGGLIAMVGAGSGTTCVVEADNISTSSAVIVIPGQAAGVSMTVYWIAWGW